jgi:hypothetical protein
MTTGKPKRLELEVSFETQPIRGRLYERADAGGSEREFSGWLGLMSAIEAARRTEPARPRERMDERP